VAHIVGEISPYHSLRPKKGKGKRIVVLSHDYNNGHDGSICIPNIRN
jgi:hypothetical protein